MPPEQRKKALLGVLLLVLGVVLYLRWPTSPASPGRTVTGRVQNRAAVDKPAAEPPDVHLEALRGEHPRPTAGARNLFRFRSRPAAPAIARAQPAPAVPVPAGPPPSPPLPPIPLKFIGLLQSEHAQRVAILSDGRGPIFGKEGDAVLGQYKILRIAGESIEIAYLDGRGRQTIRLSGS